MIEIILTGLLAAGPVCDQPDITGFDYESGFWSAGPSFTVSAAGSITPTGAVLNSLLATVSIGGSITPTGAVSNTSGANSITPSGSITPVGDVSSLSVATLSMEGEIVPVGVVSSSITALVTTELMGGQIIPSGCLILRPNIILLGSVTPTGAVVASLPATQSVAGSITPVGTIFSNTKINLVAVRRRAWALFFFKR